MDETSTPSKPREGQAPLISDLRYLHDESTAWVLRAGFLGEGGAVPLSYQDADKQRNRAGAANPVQPGEIFFTDGPAKDRFKYLGHIERKQFNPTINVDENIVWVRIEDLKANKAGTVYEIPAPLSEARQKPFIQHDRSALMALETLEQGEKPFAVEEYTFFSLPSGQEEKPYHLKSITPEQIVVDYTDSKGQKREVTIKRGAKPDSGQFR